MKKILSRLMIFAFVALSIGCQDDDIISSVVVEGSAPVSSFTYTKDFLVVSFTSTSVDAESYYWDFGDGTYSTEKSPVHTYAATGTYEAVLKVNSAAGYSDKSEPQSFYVAGQAKAFYTYTPGFGLKVNFDANNSVNVKSAKWDFGDGSPTVDGFTATHEFPSNGTYEVKLTVVGLTDDIAEYKSSVVVVADYNQVLGGDMGASASSHWSSYIIVHSGSWSGSLTYGYVADKPTGGSGGCLAIYHPGNSSSRAFIWQAVTVETGKKYRYSAQIKLPAGVSGTYFRFLTSTVLQTTAPYTGYPFSNTSPVFIEINNEATNWKTPSFAYDGDLSADWMTGSGRYNGGSQGIFTATTTGTLYIGFVLYNTWSGTPITILVDNVRFELVPD